MMEEALETSCRGRDPLKKTKQANTPGSIAPNADSVHHLDWSGAPENCIFQMSPAWAISRPPTELIEDARSCQLTLFLSNLELNSESSYLKSLRLFSVGRRKGSSEAGQSISTSRALWVERCG